MSGRLPRPGAAMSGQRWVYCGLDYAAHLLRPGGRAPGVATARCGLDVRLGEGTIVHASAPQGACEVCEGLSRLDQDFTALLAIGLLPDG